MRSERLLTKRSPQKSLSRRLKPSGSCQENNHRSFLGGSGCHGFGCTKRIAEWVGSRNEADRRTHRAPRDMRNCPRSLSLSLDEILSNWRKANFAAKTAALSSSMLTEMDYAVNGMARTRFPPIQEIWNKSTFPETDTDRLIVRGLTLCDW